MNLLHIDKQYFSITDVLKFPFLTHYSDKDWREWFNSI